MPEQQHTDPSASGHEPHKEPSDEDGGHGSVSLHDIHGSTITTGDIAGRDLTKVIINQPPVPRIPMQLPRRAEHFTGREDELAELLDALQPGRVVALTGPGGIGKSALAAEALFRLAPEGKPPARFPDGIIAHDFYAQPEAAVALEHIARSLGHEPRPTPALAAREALGERRVLLLLDGAEAADDLPAVLAVCGQCGVLVTSRRRQDAPAGRQDLAPLPVDESISLLQKWAGHRASDNAIAGQISELLGGLPLAIRLVGSYLAQREEDAADYLAWLQESPLTALDQGQRRDKSVPLLLEKSLEQVSEQAQLALAVTGLLALAPFGREAVAAALDMRAPEAGRLLGELVNYGLLLRPDHDYQVSHALVHTYARRRLVPLEEAIGRLTEHYNRFIRHHKEQGVPGYILLNAARPHVLALLDQLVSRTDWASIITLSWAIEDYLDVQGYWTELITVCKTAVAAARALQDRRQESAWLNSLGLAYRDLGQTERAIDYQEQALAISREIGDRRSEGNGLGNLGIACHALGQTERAIDYHQQALAIAHEIGHRRGEGNALGSLGLAYSDLGQTERAIDHYQQALAISREIGHRRNEGVWLSNLGNAYRDLGQTERAIDHYQQALAISREIGDQRNEGSCLGNLGNAYRDLGQTEHAIDHYQQALAIFTEIKSPHAGRVHELLAGLSEPPKTSLLIPRTAE